MVEIGGIRNNCAYYEYMLIMDILIFIALGYKADYIEDYFKNFKTSWNINLIDTKA